MKINNKNIPMIIGVAVSIILSIILAYSTTTDSSAYKALDTLNETPLIEQATLSTSNSAVTLQKMFYKDTFVGIVTDPKFIQSKLDEVYKSDYQEAFPDSKIDLSDDIYFTNFQSYSTYENIDEKIFEYLDENELFSIQVNKITFTNGAIIYVKSLDDFNSAREKFLSNYIDKETYDKLQRNEKIPTLTEYGDQIISMTVKEKVIFETGTTTIDNILLDETSILTFLSYGYNPKIETITTKEYDTIEGIASLNGMTPLQLVTINKDKLSDVNQILVPGLELGISKFNSPFTVTVQRERLTDEVIQAPETKYINDDTIPKGQQKVEVVEKDGSKDSLYIDTYINGSSVSSELKSSKTITEPVQGVIRVGTYVPPSVGSGIFSKPLHNSFVLCAYGCYGGHRGVDFSTYGSGYGPIVAVDRGVVVANSYERGWGYYIKIDHKNGYQSLYAHMVSPGYFPVGSTVSKGQNIGYVGMTGRTSYPHVHLEIYRNGAKINACTVIRC